MVSQTKTAPREADLMLMPIKVPYLLMPLKELNTKNNTKQKHTEEHITIIASVVLLSSGR